MYSISCFFCLVFLYGQVLSHNNDPFFNSHNNNNNLNHHSNFHKFNQTSSNGENEHDQVAKAEESESLFLSSYTHYEQEQEEEPIIMSLSSASSSIEALLCSGGDDSPSTFVSMECSFTMYGDDNNENDGDDQHHQNDSRGKNNMNKDTPDSQINIIMYPNNNNNYINSQQQNSQLSYQHYFDLDDYFNSDDDESSDDDDNDDDDGHSSMLSNASVGRRNNRVAVSVGGDDDGNYYNGGSSRSKNRSYDESNRDRDRNNNRFSSSTSISSVPAIAHSSKSLLFSVRGGAIAQKKKPSQHETLSKNTISKSSPVTTQTSKIITNNNNTQHNEFIRSLIVSTIVAVTYDAIFGHPLEFLKIVMQTSTSDTTYSQILKDVTQSSTGIVGIWDGFLPWGLIQSTLKGSVFGFAKEILQSYLIDPSSTLRIAMIAGIAGGCQGYALSPMLLLKTRVMTNPIFRDQTSLWSTILLSMTVGIQIIQEEGFRVLLKGSNIFAVKRVFDWSTRFYFATLFSKMIQSFSSSSQSSYTLLLSDFFGGTASTLITTPLDVLVAKIQDSKSAGIKMNAFQMIREELEEKGIEGFSQTYTKGFFARLLDVCGTTMAMKTGTKLLYEFLYNKER